MPVCVPNIEIRNFSVSREGFSKNAKEKPYIKSQEDSASLERQMRMAMQQVKDGKTSPIDDFLKGL